MSENNTTNTPEVSDPVDYKALYEETLKRAENAEAERDKQKGLKDTYAKENAEYKRKEVDRLSDEERREIERNELIERATNAEKLVAEMQHRQIGLENGFTKDEVERLIKSGLDFKVIKDIISARVDEAVKSAMAEVTKGSASNPQLNIGSTNGAPQVSDYKKYRDSQNKPNNVVEFN